jgi:hypothetical protein
MIWFVVVADREEEGGRERKTERESEEEKKSEKYSFL